MLKIGITGSVLAIILLAGIHFSERQVERETIGQEESADAVDDTRPRAARVLDLVAQDPGLEGAEIEFLLARSALLRGKMAEFSSNRGVEENEVESEDASGMCRDTLEPHRRRGRREGSRSPQFSSGYANSSGYLRGGRCCTNV